MKKERLKSNFIRAHRCAASIPVHTGIDVYSRKADCHGGVVEWSWGGDVFLIVIFRVKTPTSLVRIGVYGMVLF